MADIILKDKDGTDVKYENVNSVSFRTTTEGETATFMAQKQADWNQTDTTAVDYIKNKPQDLATKDFVESHVQEKIDAIEIPEDVATKEYVQEYVQDRIAEIEIPEGGGGASTISIEKDIFPTTSLTNFAFNSTYGAFGQEMAVDFTLNVGEEYQVTWDDKTYTCVGQDGSALISGAVILGNAESFMLAGNEEEFVLGWIDGYAMFFSTVDTAPGVEHSIRIYKTGRAVADWNQNDINGDGYIHNRPFYVDEPVLKTILPQTQMPFNYSEDDGGYVFSMEPPTEYLEVWLSDWNTAKVVWDDVSYTVHAQYFQGIKVIGNLDAYTGAGDSGEPFIVMMADASVFGADVLVVASIVDTILEDPTNTPMTSHRVSFSIIQDSIKTLDSKFIGDVPWDKITDKPFGTITAGTVVSEGSVDCNAQMNGQMYYALVEEFNIISGHTYNVEFDTKTYSITSQALGNMVELSYEGDDAFFQIINGYAHGNTFIVSTQGLHTYKVTTAVDSVKKIDKQYLPDSLPEVTESDNNKVLTVVDGAWTVASGLPDVTESDAGKFLRVSANGIWTVEAVSNAEEVTF